MKPFELRLAELHSRNSNHLRNLRAFAADADRIAVISREERQLIHEQIEHMSRLDAVLEQRMKLHNIPV